MMEKTLKQLQEYQVEAFQKGISFDVNMYVLEERAELSVKLSYLETDGHTIDSRSFTTTFSNEVEDNTDKMKMGRIRKFINDVENEK